MLGWILKKIKIRKVSKSCEAEDVQYLWHSPSAEFEKFNLSFIGQSALKYGWGIYFATSLDGATLQNKALDHIYRLPLCKLVGFSFLMYAETLKEQNDVMVTAAAKKFYGDTEYDRVGFDKSGQSFYKDIFKREEQRKPGRGEKRAALYLAGEGIAGGVIKEYEVTVVLYNVRLWRHVERVGLVRDANGMVSVGNMI